MCRRSSPPASSAAPSALDPSWPSQRRVPVLVRPAQTEGKVGIAGNHQDLLEWTFEQPPTVEPVVPVTERVESVLACQVCVLATRFGDAKIVEARICREMGLIVPCEERSRRCDFAPLREPTSPTTRRFRDPVELRKIEGDCPQAAHRVDRGFVHGPSRLERERRRRSSSTPRFAASTE